MAIPLADIRIFQDQDRILGVMKDGRFAKRDAALSRAAADPDKKDRLKHCHRLGSRRHAMHLTIGSAPNSWGVWFADDDAPDAVAPFSG